MESIMSLRVRKPLEALELNGTTGSYKISPQQLQSSCSKHRHEIHEKMKKRGRQDKQDLETKEKKEENEIDEDEGHNQGFSDWLRSVDGVEMMRLFVIANSLLVFVTIAWPNIQQTYTIIKEYIMEDEE